MSRKTLILLVAGILAFGVALMLRSNVSDEVSSDNSEKLVKILVARVDIPQGSFVRSSKHFKWMEWPSNSVNDSMIVKAKGNSAVGKGSNRGKKRRNGRSAASSSKGKLDKLDGAVARRLILKGEPILDNMLVHPDEGGFMAAVLKPGMRAISIPVDATTGNAGFIFPGDRVDLIVTYTTEVDSNDGRGVREILASETFVEDIRILAVDQQLDNPENKAILAKTITIEVTQYQAEKINVAKDLGKISLSLRSLASDEYNDGIGGTAAKRKRHITRDSDVSRMLGQGTSTGTKVRLIRGGESRDIEFR